jgi:hypothetical protein
MSHGSEEPFPSRSSLSLHEALDLSLQLAQSVKSHWTQYYAFVFALLTLLTSNIIRIGHKEAVIISIATAVFFTVNGMATIRAYVLLSLIADEAAHVARASAFLSPALRKIAASRRNRVALPLRFPIAASAHVAAASVIIYLTWKAVQ